VGGDEPGCPRAIGGALGGPEAAAPAPDQWSGYTFRSPRPAGDHEWRIVAVGDIMTPAALLQTANARRDEPDEASRGYLWPFRQVRGLVSGADLAIGNLEFPVLPGAPASGEKPFNGEPAYLDALGTIGFDLLFTANNHAYDQGAAGTEATLTELEKRGIQVLGTNHIGEPRDEVLITEIGSRDKLKVAFLNYTAGISDLDFRYNLEHLFLGRNVNYALFNQDERITKEAFRRIVSVLFPSALITGTEDFIANVSENVARAKSQGAAYVVVFLHWGAFKAARHSDEQAQLARRLCRVGADAIIGAGPHVIQPIELVDLSTERDGAAPERPYDECVVAYSLGNFISGMSPVTRTGLVLELRIAADRRGTYLRSYAPHLVESALAPRSTGGAVEVEVRRGSLAHFLAQQPSRGDQAP
jgi:poly-gamma-glutamate capsule biosynthesis protein CapA/YwtB (metallophosphatase superfamily)